MNEFGKLDCFNPKIYFVQPQIQRSFYLLCYYSIINLAIRGVFAMSRHYEAEDDDCPPCCDCTCDCRALIAKVKQPTFRKNTLIYISILILTALLVYWHSCPNRIPRIKSYHLQLGKMNSVWFVNRCLQLDDSILTIRNFSSHLNLWRSSSLSICQELYKEFNVFYTIDTRVDANELFRLIYAESDIQIKNKPSVPPGYVTSVINTFTKEHTVFVTENFEKNFEKLEEQRQEGSSRTVRDFSQMEGLHLQDGGTIYGKLSLPKTIDKLTYQHFSDFYKQIFEWFKVAYRHDPSFCYPHVLLDLNLETNTDILPTAHLLLTAGRYYGFMQMLTNTAIYYNSEINFNSNYFADILKLHNMLGLAVGYKDAYAISYLTPRREKEIWILSKNFDDDAHNVVFTVIRTYFKELGVKAISMSIYLPPLLDSYDGMQRYIKVPVLVRISSIEPTLNFNTDSLMELLSATSVHHDPFLIPKYISKNVGRQFTTLL